MYHTSSLEAGAVWRRRMNEHRVIWLQRSDRIRAAVRLAVMNVAPVLHAWPGYAVNLAVGSAKAAPDR
jgi:hypothetical protein